ncbi:MAG: tyrosine--tRNA ligase [Candidatus Magasanikbacteria bacterium]|nr:tyrosine--tRNA ligase [Candidatus Magasanikbacteria bacterium]
MKISTDDKKINELLSRGVENIYPKKEFLEARLKDGKPLTLYVGYDPTAPTLHIGNGITLLKLQQFQELGHKVIFLVGDFTGMIGDPTDKLAARQQLTPEQVSQNCALYKKQASAILNFSGDNPALVKFNGEWWGKMSAADLLNVATHITQQRLMERDMFQKRLAESKPIYAHELLYPLLQGYDSVAMEVDGEVGGNDQTFNMLVGRDLMKQFKGKEKFVLTLKLLVDDSGVKMGKTEGNMVAFSDTPEDMFGKVMRWSDGMIRGGFELCTRADVPSEKFIQAEPMKFKKMLAYEITKTFLGEEAAEQGEKNFASVIQNKERPPVEDIPEHKLLASDSSIISVLLYSGLCSSRTEARRLLSQDGVRVNDVVADQYTILKPGDIIQKGKRFFVKTI